MDEQERIAKINANAVKYLENILARLENEELSYADLLAITHAHLIATSLAGYSLESLANDAEIASTKLLDLVNETENARE